MRRTLGCISWQCDRKENFVSGDQMPKWGLFVDWWDKGQRGKNENCYKSYAKYNVVESVDVEHASQANKSLKSIIP